MLAAAYLRNDDSTKPRPAWERTLARINHYAEHPIRDERLQLLETPIIDEVLLRVIGTELPIPGGDMLIPIKFYEALEKLRESVEFSATRVKIDEAIIWLRATYPV